MEGFLIATGVVVLIWFLTKGKQADGAAPPEDDSSTAPPGETNVDKPPGRTPAPPADGTLIGKAKDKAREIGDDLGTIIGGDPPDLPGWGTGEPPPIIPDPGQTPANPIPWTELAPGFVGYFQITEGATLIKCSRRLGMPDRNWRWIRDDELNDWAVEQCPKSVRDAQYGGEKGIALNPNYGRTSGVDCALGAPGWEAKLYFTKPLTMQYPVLHYGGGPI